jgi:fermentation-respiration switch protein FrsA (DUF1100 family)
MSLHSLSFLSKQSEPSTRRRFVRGMLTRKKLVAYFVALLLFSGFGFFALRKLESAVTFHPVRYSSGSQWTLPEGAEDVWLTTSDNVRLHGWLIQSKTQPSIATIIYFHGNGGNISNVAWVGGNLSSRGFDVLLIDYRGYGRSDGEVDSERELNTDGDAAYNYIVNTQGVRAEKVVLFGQSLGATVAVDVASRKPCGAVIVESGLSSSADLAVQLLPWIPRPLYALGKNRFESAGKLAQVKSPILIVHGDPDATIPTEHGRKLYAAANEPKRLLIYQGAGHNVHGVIGVKYLDEVSNFIQQAIAKNST